MNSRCGLALPFGGLQPTLSITRDARVLFVTTLAGLLTRLLASLFSVWLASRSEKLQFHTDRTVAATSPPGRALLVAQVALSAALLMGAGLLTRSFYLLFHNDPGFDGTQILSARLRPRPGAYRDPAFDNGLNYYPVLLERIAALPGVRSVGYARAFGLADRDDVGRASIASVRHRVTSPRSSTSCRPDLSKRSGFRSCRGADRAGRTHQTHRLWRV